MNDPHQQNQRSLRSILPNGDLLRKSRLQLCLTQVDLAKEIGYSERIIRKAERGKRIDVRTLQAIFRFFQANGIGDDVSSFLIQEDD